MASDHLNIRIQHMSQTGPWHMSQTGPWHMSQTGPWHMSQTGPWHMSQTPFGLKEQGLLLYSPSTIQTLKEEISHSHAVPVNEIAVYHDGRLLDDKERVVDKRLYHVRIQGPLRALGQPTVPKTVEFGEGVYIEGAIEVEALPMEVPIYTAFGAPNRIVHLVDNKTGAILSPSPKHRLGHVLLYADWERLRPMLREVPTAEPSVWLYDRLRRDYGVLATSSLFGIHTAPLAELRRYQAVIGEWQKTVQPQEEQEQEQEEQTLEELERELEALEREEEEDTADVLDDLDAYVDDREWWK